MEWTGNQQLLFLLRSCGVGCVVGVLFDILTGWGRVSGNRYAVFVLDTVFGLPAALITFFGALIITDGRMHPLLFAGVLAGMLAEHFLTGRWISKLMQLTVRTLHRVSSWIRAMVGRCEGWLAEIGSGNPKRQNNRGKNRKKLEKKRCFFEKNT